MELGIVPIELKVKNRQLNFLYDILALNPDDPVRRTYEEEKRFPFARNWASEIKETMERLGIEETESEIAELSKECWKQKVEKIIRETALMELKEQKRKLKNGSRIAEYDPKAPNKTVLRRIVSERGKDALQTPIGSM